MRPRRVVARAAKARHGRLMVARRKSRWSAALMVFGALAAVAAGIGYFFWPQIYALIEEEMIYAAKARHWSAYSKGETLPNTPDLKNLPARLASAESSTRRTGFSAHFQTRVRVGDVDEARRQIREVRDLPDLHVVGKTRSEIETGRPPGAGRLLHGRKFIAQSEQPISSLVQSRISQHVRPRTWSHRILAHGAWRLPFHRLLRYDRPSY